MTITRAGKYLSCFFAFSFFVLTSALLAEDKSTAPATVDLGENLFYLRVTDLTADEPAIQAALKAHPALVLDLRNVVADVTAAKLLRADLTPDTTPTHTARFLLFNSNTSSTIPFAVGAGTIDDGIPGVLTITLVSASVPSDIKAQGTAENDKLVCEAIAQGNPVTSLINHQPKKHRYDEAALVRDINGSTDEDDDSDTTEAETTSASTSTQTAEAETSLTDAVLELAVQTHRAMLALKRLP